MEQRKYRESTAQVANSNTRCKHEGKEREGEETRESSRGAETAPVASPEVLRLVPDVDPDVLPRRLHCYKQWTFQMVRFSLKLTLLRAILSRSMLRASSVSSKAGGRVAVTSTVYDNLSVSLISETRY